MRKNLTIIALLIVMVVGYFFANQQKEAAWYDGFYQLCLHAPSVPDDANAPPMYRPDECADLLNQAQSIDLYHHQ